MLVGVQVMWFASILVHYISFVFVDYVDFEYLPSDPAILENVLKICMVLLA